MHHFDVLVVGGGMAGVSIACELSADRRVGVLEMEPTLAFHTTGRSAATYLESYGGPAVRALTTASRSFFERPPDTVDTPPLSPLPMLQVARSGRGELAELLFETVRALVPDVELLDAAGAREVQPLLRPGYAERAVLEPGAQAVDVHAVHEGFLRGLRRNGGVVIVSAPLVSAERASGHWRVGDRAGERYTAPVVVNAAGAWADVVAERMGARRVGLRALRRTAFTVAAPERPHGATLPLTADLDEAFYVKPEGPQFLCSPADETLQEPGDARPDGLEIARALDAINEALDVDARSVRTSWAGLRSFVADREPVVGYDPLVEGLFWFAAQGGYGIQTAPALARTGAGLLRGHPVPRDVAARGLTAAMLCPDRASLRPAPHPAPPAGH